MKNLMFVNFHGSAATYKPQKIDNFKNPNGIKFADNARHTRSCQTLRKIKSPKGGRLKIN